MILRKRSGSVTLAIALSLLEGNVDKRNDMSLRLVPGVSNDIIFCFFSIVGRHLYKV